MIGDSGFTERFVVTNKGRKGWEYLHATLANDSLEFLRAGDGFPPPTFSP